MDWELDRNNIYHLRMNDFTAPDRRMDAFPSVRYDVPPTYLADMISVHYAMDSAVTMLFEAHTVYMESGDILLTAPFAAHRAHLMQPGGRLVNVVLRPARVCEALPRLFMLENPIRDFLERCTLSIGPLFLHLPTHALVFDRAFFPEAADFCIHNPDSDPRAMLLWESRLEQLLLTLMEHPEIQARKAELSGTQAHNLSQILGYIQRHLSTASLRGAADELGWNASHLSRYIKQYTGRSFTEILQVLRLDEATTLLTHTDCTVEDAMVRVGYAGKANFYAIFRQRFGVTPVEYRRSRQTFLTGGAIEGE